MGGHWQVLGGTGRALGPLGGGHWEPYGCRSLLGPRRPRRYGNGRVPAWGPPRGTQSAPIGQKFKRSLPLAGRPRPLHTCRSRGPFASANHAGAAGPSQPVRARGAVPPLDETGGAANGTGRWAGLPSTWRRGVAGLAQPGGGRGLAGRGRTWGGRGRAVRRRPWRERRGGAAPGPGPGSCCCCCCSGWRPVSARRGRGVREGERAAARCPNNGAAGTGRGGGFPEGVGSGWLRVSRGPPGRWWYRRGGWGSLEAVPVPGGWWGVRWGGAGTRGVDGGPLGRCRYREAR